MGRSNNALEALTWDFRALNGEYDPSDIARESRPESAETIAATVEFALLTEIEAAEIATRQKQIAEWPGMLAHVRLEQGVQADRKLSDAS